MKRLLELIGIVLIIFSINSAAAQEKICSNPQCHGGKIYCEECDYTGMVGNHTCPKCNGNGYYPCPNCNGTGYSNSNNSNNSNNSSNNNSNNNNSVSAPHQFTCPECKGAKEIPVVCPNPQCHHGVISCEKCNHSGKISHRCETCGGTGEISEHKHKPCPVCKGEKYIQEEEHVPCTCRNGKRPVTQNGQTVYVDCSTCKGKGYTIRMKKVPCTHCHKSGYVIEQELTTSRCHTCEGKGTILETCTQCDGNGSYSCPTCGGHGNIRKSCSRCNGTGVIYTN